MGAGRDRYPYPHLIAQARARGDAAGFEELQLQTLLWIVSTLTSEYHPVPHGMATRPRRRRDSASSRDSIYQDTSLLPYFSPFSADISDWAAKSCFIHATGPSFDSIKRTRRYSSLDHCWMAGFRATVPLTRRLRLLLDFVANLRAVEWGCCGSDQHIRYRYSRSSSRESRDAGSARVAPVENDERQVKGRDCLVPRGYRPRNQTTARFLFRPLALAHSYLSQFFLVTFRILLLAIAFLLSNSSLYRTSKLHASRKHYQRS
ncbi:hypothetical protein DFH06DRAFT_1168540 [Mycena polygramma]|nr:hypothetical protein DFH06DRAFT_1168540 [Mycena polygramma]